MTPRDELYKRISKLQAAMQDQGIGGALLLQRADLFYFSGTAQNGHLFVPADGEAVLLVKKSLDRARQESALEQIVPFESWDNLVAIIAAAIPNGERIGLESDVLPANLYFRYQKLLTNYELVDTAKIIRLNRAVKSTHEIGLMRKAAEIGASVLNHAGQIITAGLSEVELAARLELHARLLGHQGAVRMRGFNQELYFGHIMSGSNAAAVSFFDGPTGGAGLNPSYPQGAGTAIIHPNEPILVDFVAVYEGYMVDQTRIFCLGKLPRHLEEAYHQALLINQTLARLGKPGVLCSELYVTAEKIAASADLGDYFMGCSEKINFVGHGVGLELDELPLIARGYDQPLEEGMVFALEPKFIFPEAGAVGIEDTYLVGSNGLTKLTTFDSDLQLIPF